MNNFSFSHHASLSIFYVSILYFISLSLSFSSYASLHFFHQPHSQNQISYDSSGTFKYMSPERILNKPYSYASDIWAMGVLLIECATAKFPYDTKELSYIDLVQTILESPAPSLPRKRDGFTPEFHQFVMQCVRKNPKERLPADILLGSPWLRKHGAVNIANSIRNVKAWIESL